MFSRQRSRGIDYSSIQALDVISHSFDGNARFLMLSANEAVETVKKKLISVVDLSLGDVASFHSQSAFEEFINKKPNNFSEYVIQEYRKEMLQKIDAILSEYETLK